MKKLIALAVVVILVVGGYLVADYYARQKAEAAIAKITADYKEYVAFNYEKLDTSLFGQKMVLHGVSIKLLKLPEPKETAPGGESAARKALPEGFDFTLKADRVIINDYDLAHDYPHYYDTEAKGISFESTMIDMKEIQPKLAELGLESLPKVDASVVYTYDPAAKLAKVKEVFDVTDLMQVRIDGQLGGMDFDKLYRLKPKDPFAEPDPEVVKAIMDELAHVNVLELKLTLVDDSLMKRLVDLGAKEQKLSPEEFKKGVLAKMAQTQTQLPGEREKAMLDQAIKFVEDPQAISVSIHPADPQALAGLANAQGPTQIMELLNLQVEYQKKP